MKDPVMMLTRARVDGKVKYKGDGSGNTDYKTGTLSLETDDGKWRLCVWFSTKPDKPILSVPLHQHAIKSIIKKSDRLIVEVPGFNVYFTAKQAEFGRLNQVEQLLSDIKDGKMAPERENKAEVCLSKNFLSHSNTSSPGRSPDSSPKFTSVKENRKTSVGNSSFSTKLFEDDFSESKENFHSGYHNSAEKFLKRGEEKSQSMLKSIDTSGFYSSTPAQQRVFTRIGDSSGSGKRPGLMPLNPTPQKRPRLLSDVKYTWQKTSQDAKSQQQSLLGFSNIGNTCYMNAILQSLFGLNPFSNDLLNSFRKRGRSFSPNSLYCSLTKLLKIRRRPGCPDSIKRELLRNVKSAISGTAKRFSGYQQHDAHEFLSQVLDQLKEEIVKFNKATPSPNREPSEDGELVNPTVENFEFEVLHTITCAKCGEEVAKSEQFNDLSLEMPKRSYPGYPKSLQDALDAFLQTEEIEYSCSKCRHSMSKVTHKFTKLPRILILHLKRYTYNMGISQQSKMGQRIHIPSYVSLSYHVDNEVEQPPPVPCVLACYSPIKHVTDAEDRKGEQSRRKLDYSSNTKYTFKSLIKKNSPDEKTSEVGDQDSKSSSKEFEDSKLFSNFSMDESTEDADMARAIALSLQEVNHEEQNQEYEEGGESKVNGTVEVCQQEMANKGLNSTLSETELQQMTEEQRIEMAIQQSLMESQANVASFSSSTSDLSTSSIVKECKQAFLDSRTDESAVLEDNLPSIKFKKRSRSLTDVSHLTDIKTEEKEITENGLEPSPFKCLLENNDGDFDEVDGSVMSPIANKSKMSGEVLGDLATTKTSETKQNGGCTKEQVDYIFGDNSPQTEIKPQMSVVEDMESTEGEMPLINDLAVWEEKENLKPQGETQVFSDKDNIPSFQEFEPSQEDVMRIKEQRALNENGILPCSYRLVSLVNHIGHSSSAGHYISDVYDMKKKTWLSFDDVHVSKMQESDIRAQRERNGYIFFYMCKEVFEELESLHTASLLSKEN